MRMLAVPAVLLLAMLPAELLACTRILPSHPLTQDEVSGRVRDHYFRAGRVVEVVALADSVPGRGGQVRVTRAFKGNIRRGTVLHLATVEDSMCGAGEFTAGSRGIILLARRDPLVFDGYLTTASLSILRRAGLIPRR